MLPATLLLIAGAAAGGVPAAPTPAPAPHVYLKGAFHQHATQPLHKCHRGAPGIDGCGPGCMHQQDDGGTDADVLLEAIINASLGYDFVGLIGNEELPTPPRREHGLPTLRVTENQMAAICAAGSSKHCKEPCEPGLPPGSGPWRPTSPPINNLHREYIEGVPGVWVQHPTTDPERDQILAHMRSGADNLRGLEVFNSWADQAWDAEVPRSDAEIDPLYPVYRSANCTAWDPYATDPERYPEGSCTRFWGMSYWDATLRALKRPIWGLADDDGFVYTGDSDEPVYRPGRHDVKSNGPAWFRFGVGYSMVRVPAGIGRSATAADISKAVDRGDFYASTGIELVSSRARCVCRRMS